MRALLPGPCRSPLARALPARRLSGLPPAASPRPVPSARALAHPSSASALLASAPPMPLSGFVQRCSECNDPAARAGRLPLSADGVVLGFVSPATSDLLLAFPDVFEGGNGGLRLSRALAGVEARTVAVDGVMRALHAAGHLRGWRGERLSVGPRFGETAFLLERSAAPLLGVRAYGVHVNCFVRDEGGGPPRVWVAKRAAGKGTWPGMWDHAVAGGQPHGISLADNVAKEAAEEAGVPEALARTAVPVGAVSYETVSPCGGFKRDVLFCFDLALPPGFVPVPVDGEVESFELWPAARLLAVVRDTRTVKPNCNLVIIDWAIRHGLIPADAPGYLQLLAALRAGELA